MTAGLFLLVCLLSCGYVGAALALAELDAGSTPRLGRLYRLYAAASNAYCARRDRGRVS